MKDINYNADRTQVIFNTGCGYTAEGQIITATLIDTETLGNRDQFTRHLVHFDDESRGISGMVKVVSFDPDSINQAYINDNCFEVCITLAEAREIYGPKEPQSITLNQVKASTPRPVTVTYKGHEFTLADSTSWVEYQVIDSDGCGHDVNSIAEVKDWIRTHVAAAEELQSATALVITREFLGHSRVIREFDNLADAKAEMMAMHRASQSLTTSRVVELSKDLTIMSVRGYRGSEYPTYYRIEAA